MRYQAPAAIHQLRLNFRSCYAAFTGTTCAYRVAQGRRQLAKHYFYVAKRTTTEVSGQSVYMFGG